MKDCLPLEMLIELVSTIVVADNRPTATASKLEVDTPLVANDFEEAAAIENEPPLTVSNGWANSR